MAPEDPYIEGGGEERDEPIRTEPSHDSPIEEGLYEGKPVQAGMKKGGNPPRHNILRAEYIGSSNFGAGELVVKINIKPTNATPVWDFITSLLDTTTGATADQPDYISTTNNVISLHYYSLSNNAAATVHAHTRTYKAFYNSGHEEDFTILVPGYYQSVAYYFSHYSILGQNANEVYPCIPTNPNFQFNVGHDWACPGCVSTDLYQFTQIDTNCSDCYDPSGIWTNGASLIQTTSTSSLPLTLTGLGGNTDNFYLSNNNGGGSATTYNVDPGQLQRQKIQSIVAVLVPENHYDAINAFSSFNTAPNSGLTWGEIETGFGGNLWFNNYNVYGGFPFISFIEYAHNLSDCTAAIYAVEACLDINSMAYYGYTDNNCDGQTIAANILADPSLAVWTDPGCCPTCVNPLSLISPTIFSTSPLTINAQGFDPTTIGGTDGYIDVTIEDQGFDASGVPQGLPTGVSNYTFVLENVNGVAMSGNSAGVNISSGSSLATTINSFTFGYGVAATNNNGGLLQTGATGNATYVASSAQGYVPASAGTTNTSGLKAGTYIAYVFDSSATVCLGQTTITLYDPSPRTGCTDSNALNTDPLANIANNSTCHYCDDTTGELIDGNGSIVNSIANIVPGSINIGHASHTTSTDGAVFINISASSPFQTYINDVVNASSVQNADYTISLHRWTSQTSSGSFAASSTIGTLNNGGAGWNVTLDTQTLGSNVLYGYYTIKIWISDPDATVEIEECYELIDVIIKIPVCLDNGIATAADGVIVSDPNLYFHDPALCNAVNNYCCDEPIFQQSVNSVVCEYRYESIITCSPGAEYLTYVLQFLDNGNWIDVGTPVTIGVGNGIPVTSPYNTGIVWTESSFIINGTGTYRVQWLSEYSNSDDCVIYSNTQNIAVKFVGCMDPLALNYDPLAQCPGPCIYCTYGCLDKTALNYDPLATCSCDDCCIWCKYGCMDPTATNYDPTATCDNHDCEYDALGCTDPLAINYDPSAVVDDGSCYYCDDPPMTYTYTTTDATVTPGSCLSNIDGCINITVDSTTCTTTWKLVECYFFCGISSSNVILVTNVDYTLGSVATICNLAGGHMYTLILEDCNGCQMQIEIFVGTEGNECGCTDPAADNYNPLATIDNGSCIYCGCTDPNATNYNPGATSNCIPDTCNYPSLTPPCIPPSIDATIKKLELCIAENGFNYYNKLVTGQSDDCSIMNVWKLILMLYLLKRKGLDCIYNCEDASTPDPADVYISCEDLWITGGPTTGLNDPNVNTLIPAVGTTSDIAMFTTGSLTPGDIIKHHNSGYIWIFYGPGQNGPPAPVSVAGLDPENASGNLSGYWGFCNDSMRYISNSNNINYIDNFINFANKFCRDCNNDPKLLTGSASNLNIPIIQQGIDGIDGIEI